MLQCPLPPTPTLDLLANPGQFSFSFAVMLLLAGSGLAPPGERRLGSRLAYFALGTVLLFSGYAVGFGTAQHWIDGLGAWEGGLPRGCFSQAVSAFVLHETDFALKLEYVGRTVMGIGAFVGGFPSVMQIIHWVMARRHDCQDEAS